MPRPDRAQLPHLPRRQSPRPPRRRLPDVVLALPGMSALLVMAAVIAVAIPATPKGSPAPGIRGVAAFTTVMTVKPATRAGVRAVLRRAHGRGWRRG